MDISAIVPCYNEEKSLALFYQEFCRDIARIEGVSYELILVDDGSTDGTLREMKELAAKDSHVRYLSFSRNFGKESAIYAGLENARGDFCVLMDADLQDPPSLLPEMYGYVKECIVGRPKLLDLYCGVGSIGIFCADKCKEVIGIEINKDAIDNANINKKLNHIDNIRFMCLNANKINYGEGEFDVVIVDPPRGGLDSKTIQTIKNICGKMVIYVSCNPVTLARDFNHLRDEYKLVDMRLFDMFPNTYHVESVVLLQKK